MNILKTLRVVSMAVAGLPVFAGAASAQIAPELTRHLQNLVDATPTMVPLTLDFQNADHVEMLTGLAAALPLDDERRASFQSTLERAVNFQGTRSDSLRNIQAVNLNEDSKNYQLGPITSVIDIQTRHDTIAVNGVVSIAAPPLKCFGIIGLSANGSFENVQFEFVEQQYGCPNMQLRAEVPMAETGFDRAEDAEPAAFTLSVAEYADGEVKSYADGSNVSTAIEYEMSSTWPPQDPMGDVIKVCVYRSNTDCSYSYQGNVVLDFPIQGSAKITGGEELFVPTFAASANTLVQRQSGGGCYMFDVEVNAGSGLDLSYSDADKKVAWDISNIQMYNPDSCLSGEVPVDYYFALQIETTGTPVSGVQNIYVATPHYLSTTPNLELKPMVVNWGCVAQGTLVLRADGTESAIEELKVGAQIALNAERSEFATLIDVTIGTEQEPMVVITSKDGQMLSMTAGHPVPVDGRIIRADEVEVGMVLQGQSAMDIATIERVQSEAPVYNLKLGTEQERAKFGHDGLTFVANGMVVGDADMQQNLAQSRLPAPPPIIARVQGRLQTAALVVD